MTEVSTLNYYLVLAGHRPSDGVDGTLRPCRIGAICLFTAQAQRWFLS